MSWLSDWLRGRERKPKPPKPPKPAPVVTPPPAPLPHLPMGVSVFCGWADPRPEFEAVPGVMCPAERPWAVLQTEDRKPALGYYDEADPTVTAWRLKNMENGGIDYAVYQLEWAHEHTQPTMLPSYRKKLASPLTMSHCADNHSQESRVKFCISLWDVMAYDPLWQEMKSNGWTKVEVMESWRQFAYTVAMSYMARRNYFTIDGKPVLFRGNAQTLQFYESEFGVTPASIVNCIRETVRDHTGKELYLVATSTNPDDRPKLKGWGFDCLTEYLLHGNDWNHAMDIYRYWWTRDLAFCREQGLQYIVPATSGYDSEAWGNPEIVKHVPTPAEFTEHLKAARKLARDNADICKAVCTYSWNERGESKTVIEPNTPELGGDSMLLAHNLAL